MAYPNTPTFTSPVMDSAWVVVGTQTKTVVSTNGAGLLTAARLRLGLPATPRDLKWDPQLLAALRDRMLVWRARGDAVANYFSTRIPSDRVTREAVAAAWYMASDVWAPLTRTDDTSPMQMPSTVDLPRLGDLTPGAPQPFATQRIGSMEGSSWIPESTLGGPLPSVALQPVVPAVVTSVVTAPTMRGPAPAPAPTTGAPPAAGTNWAPIAVVAALAAVGIYYATRPAPRRRR